jgi:Trk K+ transport system NAD-binding subunit
LQLAMRLRLHQEQVIILDNDQERTLRARQRGFETHQTDFDAGDPTVGSALRDVQTLVCSYADMERSFQVCQVARTVFGIPHVVARVSTPGDIVRFEQIGVSVINAALDQAALLVMLARNPGTYALLTRTDDNKEVYEVLVENFKCASKTLRQLHLPGDILVLAVRRNGDLLVPHGNTQIEMGDYLTLVSSLEWVAVAHQLFLPSG